MSDREKLEKGDEEAKETDTRPESTSMEETEGQDTDLGTSEADRRHERDPRSSGEKKESATQMRHEPDQSEYRSFRSGVANCNYYMEHGRCGFGRKCRFNHPPMRHEPSPYPVPSQLPESSQMMRRHETGQQSPYPDVRDCRQYVQTGECSYGPKCRFNHPPPTNPAPVLPQSVSRPNCKFFQKGSCKYGSECRFTHSMGGDGAEPMNQATTWGKNFHEKRHGAKSRSRPWKRERQGYDVEEQEQKKRKVENLRIGHTLQSGEGGSQTAQRLEIPENPNVIAQENQQEQADMEGQNREAQEKAEEERRQLIAIDRTRARLRLERMRPRVLTDNVDQVREVLPDIGIDRKEGDGF